ncbi:MAG TPA: FAD-binding oxidoreductase [Gaiellales bacterium]
MSAPDQPRDALERRYRARSLWLDGLAEPLAPRPPLAGDTDCDVAIVGAGFTGLWAAYYLKRHQPDLRIVVVEREIAGYGPSGRNGGWVSSGISGSASAYRRRGGTDAVRRAERETERTVDEIGAVAGREGIECGYLKAGDLIVATTPPQRDRLVASARANGDLGATDDDVRVLSPEQSAAYARVAGCVAASYSPHAARVNPAQLVRGLAAACERLGVTIHERTAALSVEPRAVRCQGGRIRAETVLRATESYTTQLRGQALRYLPLYSLMIATEPLPADVWHELGWRDGLLVGDRHHLFFYAQRTADGRIAIGGRGAPYRLRTPIDEAHERSAAVRARLERALLRHFPAAAGARITHHWGGPLAVPRDWSMSIGYDRSSGFGWSGGYSGHGVVSANIGGRTLADLVLGRESDLVSLPWVGHRSRRWEPEPLRFLASRAIVRVLESADRSEDTTGRRARRTNVLAPVMPPH